MSDEHKDLTYAREAARGLADYIETQIQLTASQKGMVFSAGKRVETEDFEEGYRAIVEVHFECVLGDLKIQIYDRSMVGPGYNSNVAHIKVFHPSDLNSPQTISIDESIPGFRREHFSRFLEHIVQKLLAEEQSLAEEVPATELNQQLVEELRTGRIEAPTPQSQTITTVFSAREALVLELYRRARGLTSGDEAIRVIVAGNIAKTPSDMHKRAKRQVIKELKQ